MKPIRLGIIGMGYTGRQQQRAAAEVAALSVVAAADVRPIEPRDAGGLTVHADWRTLLADTSLDAVSICLPHALHEPVALAALAAGKHVLLEKPIGRDGAEARRIVEAAERAGRVLLIEMTHRFYPPVRAAREVARSGRLGKLLAVEDRIVERFVGTLAPWMLERAAAGGGAALTSGIHMLDRLAFVTGQRLEFLSGSAGWAQRTGDVEDTAAMHLRLADGTPVNFLTAWSPVGQGVDDELTLYGTDGTLRVWAWRGWRFEPAQGPAEQHAGFGESDDHYTRVRAGMRGALAEFASAITQEREPDPPPRAILAAQEIIDAFYRYVSGPPSGNSR